MASQCMKQIRTVEEFKQFIWTFISETFSAVRVDVVHKQRNVSLSQLVKRSPFGTYRMNSWFFSAEPFCPGEEASQ